MQRNESIRAQEAERGDAGINETLIKGKRVLYSSASKDILNRNDRACATISGCTIEPLCTAHLAAAPLPSQQLRCLATFPGK